MQTTMRKKFQEVAVVRGGAARRGVDNAAVLSELDEIFNIERSVRKRIERREVKARGQHVLASDVPAGAPTL